MSKILNNLPVEDLNEDNDYLGIIDKGQIIKTFLESNTEEFKDIKMFSLYGEWGSGKSTLMLYLQDQLKETFNTFFFEAWEFEKDDNLPISLLDFLLNESNTVSEEFYGDILKYGGKILRGFGNSIKFNVPLYPKGPSIRVDPSKFIDEFNNENKSSFFKSRDNFKSSFKKWEGLRNENKRHEYNVVFIDDLDRCEPENVLNLLSALKLFFTYGQKTIFFCGVDKKAVDEAVKTKYGEVVIANEYLEKIFDISFSMPKHDDLLKLVSQYFDNNEVEILGDNLDWSISNFFRELDFTNPRRVKKVLNKFLVLKNVKSNLPKGSEYIGYIPSFIDGDEGNYFETILTLYFILAMEFEPTALECVFNLKRKHLNFCKTLKDNVNHNNLNNNIQSLEWLMDDNMINEQLKIFNSTNQYRSVIYTFLPLDAIVISTQALQMKDFNKIRVANDTLEYKFVKYLVDNVEMFHSANSFSTCSLNSIKHIIRRTI
ncbi:KAP family P-loop NTPase fold protein [Hyunsoonleella ulvae]|uniref:KAP family P-loop NTPase fold protein n=1 Tax=Hyunsoonleella ulvae TaxID=2799948 RepID=UPI001939CCD3|nr:P-loop NTPase fold protein [Hyunsoonleella ulvae]